MVDDPAPGFGPTDRVLAVSEVDPNRDGCLLCFHGSMKITHEASHGPVAFPSILVLNEILVWLDFQFKKVKHALVRPGSRSHDQNGTGSFRRIRCEINLEFLLQHDW